MKPMLKLLPLSLLAVSVPAFAHLGGEHAHTVVSGVLHPLSGWDHALVAFVVGLIVAQAARAAAVPSWRLPALFLGGMTLGMAAGVVLPFGAWVEQGIVLSLLAAGLLLAQSRVAATPLLALLAVAVVMFSGAAHGVVHAVEAGAQPGYLAGILAGTALLHAAGIAAGRALQAQVLVLRGAGAFTVAAGLGVVLAGG